MLQHIETPARGVLREQLQVVGESQEMAVLRCYDTVQEETGHGDRIRRQHPSFVGEACDIDNARSP
jgi:hypothetical protein